LSLYLA